MNTKMKDGEGALYFVKPEPECSKNNPGPARSFFDASSLVDPVNFTGCATKKTRQQLREDSPSGLVSMPSYLGKSRFVAFICKVLRRA